MPIPHALDIARALIAFPSVTPADAGALPYLRDLLAEGGFAAELVTFSAPGAPGRRSTSTPGSGRRRPTSPSPATPTSSPRATRRAGGFLLSRVRWPMASSGAAGPAT